MFQNNVSDKRMDYNNHEMGTSARPRRISEVSMSTAAKPLPKESAFFILPHTNK